MPYPLIFRQRTGSGGRVSRIACAAVAAAAAAAISTPSGATSCRYAEPETAVRDFVSICWAGVGDRQVFDAARDGSPSRYRPIDGLTRFVGLAVSLEYDAGRTCTLSVGMWRSRPRAEEIVAGLSRELGLPRAESRFDPATLTRTYSWPEAGGAEARRRLEAAVRFDSRPRHPFGCNSDEMTITVRNASAT